MRIVEVIGPGIARLPVQQAASAPNVALRRAAVAVARGSTLATRDAVPSSDQNAADVVLSPEGLEAARQLAAGAGASSVGPAEESAQTGSAPDLVAQAPVVTSDIDSQAAASARDPAEQVTDTDPVNAANITYELGPDGWIYAVVSGADQAVPASDDAQGTTGGDGSVRSTSSAGASAAANRAAAQPKATRA